jgi:hypothetical protein
MDTISRAFARTALVVAISATVAGCGSQTVAGTAAPAPAAVASTAAPTPTAAPPTAAGGSAQQEVEVVFHRYYEALLNRDFATACAFNAPETTEQLLANVRGRGATVGTCEEALTHIYAQPGAAEQVDAIVRSATVQSVEVNGDSALITWSAGAGGQRPTVKSALRRIDGAWKLVDTGA